MAYLCLVLIPDTLITNLEWILTSRADEDMFRNSLKMFLSGGKSNRKSRSSDSGNEEQSDRRQTNIDSRQNRFEQESYTRTGITAACKTEFWTRFEVLIFKYPFPQSTKGCSRFHHQCPLHCEVIPEVGPIQKTTVLLNQITLSRLSQFRKECSIFG